MAEVIVAAQPPTITVRYAASTNTNSTGPMPKTTKHRAAASCGARRSTCSSSRTRWPICPMRSCTRAAVRRHPRRSPAHACGQAADRAQAPDPVSRQATAQARRRGNRADTRRARTRQGPRAPRNRHAASDRKRRERLLRRATTRSTSSSPSIRRPIVSTCASLRARRAASASRTSRCTPIANCFARCARRLGSSKTPNTSFPRRRESMLLFWGNPRYGLAVNGLRFSAASAAQAVAPRCGRR